MFDRVIWIVLDSVGVGEMPDAAAYGDNGSDTLGNIARVCGLDVPNLCRLGLGNLKPIPQLPRAEAPEGSFGRCALASPGERYYDWALGDGGYSSCESVSALSERISSRSDAAI